MLELLAPSLVVVAATAYAAGVVRLRRGLVQWHRGRSICLAAGTSLVVVAALPPVATDDDIFSVHVAQHLLVAVAAPALLALSAPVTLALRLLPARPRHRLVRVLHSRAVAWLTSGVTVVVLSIGGLFLLYLTPLYAATERSALLHAAVHLHMFAAGCLFSWVVVGRDPLRATFGLRTRLLVLVATAAAHDTLSKLMYARALPAGAGTLTDRHLGAELLYYGSTALDLALAVVVMAQWWRVTGRELARVRRRSLSASRPS